MGPGFWGLRISELQSKLLEGGLYRGLYREYDRGH